MCWWWWWWWSWWWLKPSLVPVFHCKRRFISCKDSAARTTYWPDYWDISNHDCDISNDYWDISNHYCDDNSDADADDDEDENDKFGIWLGNIFQLCLSLLREVGKLGTSHSSLQFWFWWRLWLSWWHFLFCLREVGKLLD